jgi:methionine-rich copper-binding protein CopC
LFARLVARHLHARTLNLLLKENARMKRIIVPLVLALALLVAGPRLVSAHAKLVSSTPAEGAQIALTDAPTSVTLTFSEEVAKDVTTISVTGADGAEATTGAATVNFDNPMVVTAQLKALSPGPYAIKWHAVTADDNGQTDGTINFMIVNNTGGGTSTGGTTNNGGTTGNGGTTTTSGGTTSDGGGTTLPPTGEPTTLPLIGLALAALILGAGLALRRRATVL